MKPCDAKTFAKTSVVPIDATMRNAEYLFKREGSRMTLTFDSGLVQIYAPDIHAFVVAYDPKRPPKITPPTAEELAALNL